VVEDDSGAVVTERPIAMPNTGSWSRVGHSTFVDAHLTAGREYRGHFNYNDVFAIKALLKKATG
jgi:hypothetical protein